MIFSMENFKETKEKGFTLIELLVVISIIALLSVIILGSLNDSRDRAQNTKKNQLANQYVNAIELYYSSRTEYPYFSGMVQNSFYCLGETSDTGCQGGWPFNNSLNTQLSEYLPGPPADDFSVLVSDPLFGDTDYKGITYRCTEVSNNKCLDYELWWYLINDSQNCIQGATDFQFDEHSYCIYGQ